MKVLIVHSLYYPDELGGAEAGVRLLAEELARRGFSVVVTCLSSEGRWERTKVGEVAVVRIPLANLYWPFGLKTQRSALGRIAWHLADSWNSLMSRRLATVIDLEKPDLVNIHNLSGFSASVIPCAVKRDIPVVAVLHDYYFVCGNTAMFRRGANCVGQCLHCHVLTAARKYASRLTTSVVGVSQATLNQVQQSGAFRGVPAFVNLNAHPHLVSNVTRRRDHGPGEPLQIGFLGRLSVTKGVEVIIEAMGLLRDIPVTASIAGRGTDRYEALLKAMTPGLPIEFVGHTEPGEFFRKIDLLIVPSKWREPMPRVLLEAWSYGVPVVGAETGGIQEAVHQTGAGMLFRPGDAVQLATIVRGLVEHGFEGARWQRVCAEAAASLTFDHHVDKLIRIFSEAIERMGSRTGRGSL
jgi:glycosyltransferase involved in cell wall biosynthesis